MVHPRTVTQSDLRRLNRSAVLEVIRRNSPISRSQVADQLGISLPTVISIADDLILEGFVRHQGPSTWQAGRRRMLLEFNGQAQAVIGIDLGGTKILGAVADLTGNTIDQVDIRQHSTLGEESFARVAEVVEMLMVSPRLAGRHIRGIGVGAPGITRPGDGVVTYAYTLGWQDFPLKARLAERFRLPVRVDNDVNLAALGELWFGAGRDVQNMILIAIGTGIGAGIMLDGALYRGAHGAAGEIGHMIPGREFLGHDHADFGAFESAASGTGVVESARRILASQRLPAELAALHAEDVFEAARQGQAWARQVVDEVVDYLAIAVANLNVAFDPELIVLGGGVSRSADLLIEPILSRLAGSIPKLPSLALSQLGPRAVAMGTIVNVLHGTDEGCVIHKLL